MLNKINYYIFKKFLYSFLLTFLIISTILFIGDFVEQFRKSSGKDVPINIILQLTIFNFPNLINFIHRIYNFIILFIGKDQLYHHYLTIQINLI